MTAEGRGGVEVERVPLSTASTSTARGSPRSPTATAHEAQRRSPLRPHMRDREGTT
jgi:hypothetical protein